MNKYSIFAIIIFSLFSGLGCKDPKPNAVSTNSTVTVNTEKKDTEKRPNAGESTGDSVSSFVPQGFIITEKIYGDLNKDGLADCALLIKGTDKKNLVKDANRGELDRNRRGIVILFKSPGGYAPVLKNPTCFSSGNEDGGVYYAPELSVDVKNGNLIVAYAHGRYGNWSYTFRNQNADFELIGYDASDNSGPVVNSETSINFLTKKKIVKTNTNEGAEGGDEVFKQTVTRVNKGSGTKLSEIKDFDELEVSGD